MNKTKLTKFKKSFLQQKTDILNRESPAPIEEGSDEVDIAQSLIINDMIERMGQRDKDTILRINEALHRIEDGSFGICEACEEVIPEKRLEAMPLCTLCVSCAENEEKRARQYRH